MPTPKLTVRESYQYRCGYCGVSEAHAGGELTIDHFQPRSAGGGENEENLVYACIKCNQYKGEFWPTEADLERDRRVLHPFLDDLSEHIVEHEQTAHLHALTNTGAFHITLLRLNRPQLVEHRLIRRIEIILREKYRLLEKQNIELQKTIEAQTQYIQMLEAQLDDLRRS